MTLCTRRLLVVSLTALMFLLLPGSAVADDGISFLGNHELTVTLNDSTPTVLQVKVINSSDASQDIHLDLVGLVNEDGVQIPPGALPHNLPLTARNVASGTVTTFDLTFIYVDGLSGSYTGQLVTYGSDGSIDRLDLTLVVEEKKKEPVVPDAAILEPDYLETVTLVTVNRYPSPLAYFGLHRVTMPTLSVNETLSRTRSIVGSLSGDNGELGQVVQDGTTLRVKDITQAGEYVGRIDLLPNDKERGDVTTKLQVRDVFWWPLLVLVVGLLLSTLLDRYFKVGRPHKRLQINLERLKEQALRLQMEAKQALPSDWPFEDDVYRIYDKKFESGEKTKTGLLARAAMDVMDASGAAGSDEEHKKWRPDGAEFKRIQEYVDALPGLHQLSQAAFMHYQSLRERVLNLYPEIDLEQVPVLKQVIEAVKPRLIMDAAQLKKLQEDLKTASGFVTDFSHLYQQLVGLMNLAQQSTHKARAKALLDRLVSEAIVNADWLVEIDAAAKRLELDIQAAQVREREESSVLLGPRDLETEAIVDSWSLWIALPALPDVRELFSLLQPVETISEKTSKDLQKELRQLDWAFNVISGFIVVVTGLSVLYLGNASFGSLPDYVGLLLWGTVVDEGFKLARQLAPSLLGRLER